MFGVWGLGFRVWYGTHQNQRCDCQLDLQVSGLGFGFRLGFRVGVWGPGFGVEVGVLGFGVGGLGFGVWDLGFKVQGLKLRSKGQQGFRA